MKWFIQLVKWFSIGIVLVAIGSILIFGVDIFSFVLLLFGSLTAYGSSWKFREEFAEHTGCYDISNDEIYIGDRVLVKSEETGYRVKIRTVRRRKDGISGFVINIDKTFSILYDVDNEHRYSIMKI